MNLVFYAQSTITVISGVEEGVGGEGGEFIEQLQSNWKCENELVFLMSLHHFCMLLQDFSSSSFVDGLGPPFLVRGSDSMQGFQTSRRVYVAFKIAETGGGCSSLCFFQSHFCSVQKACFSLALPRSLPGIFPVRPVLVMCYWPISDVHSTSSCVIFCCCCFFIVKNYLPVFKKKKSLSAWVW